MSDDPTLGDTQDEKAPEDWQTQARAAGYSWGDINGHVATASAQALDAGYTPQEVDSYLGYKDPAPALQRFTNGFSQLFDDTPQALDGLANSTPKLDLTQADWRGDYVSALQNKEVKGAEDFAEHYAASALNAAHTDDRLDDSNGALVDARVAAGARAANDLVGGLPARADFIDAALSLAGTDNPVAVQQNLMNHWRDTGQAPVDAALAAQNDKGLLSKLLSFGDPEGAAAAETSKAIEPAIDQWIEWRNQNADASVQASVEAEKLFQQGKISEAIEKFQEGLGGGFVGPTEMAGAKGATLLDHLLGTMKVIDPSAEGSAALRFDPAAAVAKPDPLLHEEAKEAALQPPKTETQAALEAEKPAPKRPSYSFKEASEVTDAYAENPGHKTFELHKDGEPVGFAEVSFPQDRPGVAVLDNIASDERAGSMGPRAVRDVAKQFFEAHPDIESIEGFRVSGARIQSGEGAGTMTLQRDQVLKQPAPAQVQELADGYRATGGFTQLLKNFGRDLLSNESGALKLFPDRDPNYRPERDFMEKGWTTRQGEREQTIRQINETFEPLRKIYNGHMQEWQDELAKGPMGNPMGTVIGQMVNYVEGRSAGATLAVDHPLRPLADSIRAANQKLEGLMQAAEARGEISVGGYWQDYMRHLWSEPNRADTQFSGMGKLGTNASFKARTYPTMADGLQAGLVPKMPDMIDLTMWDITSKLRYMDAANQLSEAASLGHVQFGKPDFGAPNANWQPLKGGVAETRQAYATEGFVQSWNNMVDRGLFQHPVTAKGIETLNYASNLMTAVKLLNPLFHLQTVGTANIASGIAQGLEEGARQDFGRMMRTLAAAPGRPITDYLTGRSVNAKFLAGTDPAVQDLVRAGLRINRLGTFQELGRSPDLWTSLSRGSMRNEYRAALDQITNSPTVWDGAKNVASMIGMTANKIMSSVNSPVFGHLIPTLQAGAAYKRMQSFLAANPGVTEEARWLKARDIVRDVENRMGELNMDTVFWPRWAKEAAHGTLLSTSWVYGTYRGLAAAAGYDIERRGFSARLMGTGLSSVVGTVLAYSMANSIANFIHTGELPGMGRDGSWQDFLNYRTGEHTPSGLPKRGMIPSELKEIYDLGSIVAKSNGPLSAGAATVNYALGKVNPILQMGRVMLPGELSPTDAIGHHIEEQPGGTGRWMAGQVEPIFWNALFGGNKNSGLSGFERFLGEKEAPKWVTDYDAFQKGIGGVREKFRREEISRARKEEAQREYPSGYDIPAPSKRTRGSRGGHVITGP